MKINTVHNVCCLPSHDEKRIYKLSIAKQNESDIPHTKKLMLMLMLTIECILKLWKVLD